MKTSESDRFCLRFEQQMQEGGHTNRWNYFDIFAFFTKETQSRSQKYRESNAIKKEDQK